MTSVRYANKETIDVFTIFRDTDKVEITNATGEIAILRTSNNEYWDGDSWETAPTQLSMTEVSEANSPGLWKFSFDTSTFSPDSYLFFITDASGNAANSPQDASAIVGDALVVIAEQSAAGVMGRVVYDSSASTITLYKFDDPNTILQVFDAEDVTSNPASVNRMFEKIPQ